MANADVLKELARVEDLPTLPDAVTRVMSALDAPDPEVERVASLLIQDAAMTGRLLRVANSILYNASGMSTTSVAEAVSRIGLREGRTLVLSLGVVEAFASDDDQFDYRAFWKHSFTTALAAGAIAARAEALPSRPRSRDNPYFVAGLLHDVGILLLHRCAREHYANVCELAMPGDRPLAEIELEELGATHGQVCAALIRRWGLPWEVAAAAELHHHPSEAPRPVRDYVQVVHVADWLSNEEDLGCPVERESTELDPSALDGLGISREALPELAAELAEVAERSDLLVAIALPD